MSHRGPFRSSEHYHSRAEECRTIASLFNNDATRAKMLIVADDYDRMARNAEAIEAGLRTAATLEVTKKAADG